MWKSRKTLMVSTLVLSSFVQAEQNQSKSENFRIVTYNIAGVPLGLSPSNPAKNTKLIGQKLNAFDIAFVQEDFGFHRELLKGATVFPFRSEPKVELPNQIEEWSDYWKWASYFMQMDGLTLLSKFKFPRYVARVTWEDCFGYDTTHMADCWVSKGFFVAPVQLAEGVTILMVNVHFDAGELEEDRNARRLQAQQLLQFMKKMGQRHPWIVAGDFNLTMEKSEEDKGLLEEILREGQLKDSCFQVNCNTEKVGEFHIFDRVLYRSSPDLKLEAISWSIAGDFVDEKGKILSDDHYPIVVGFKYSKAPRPAQEKQ